MSCSISTIPPRSNAFVTRPSSWSGNRVQPGAKLVNVQVISATPNAIELRILLTAASTGATADLCAEIREKLIGFLQRDYPIRTAHDAASDDCDGRLAAIALQKRRSDFVPFRGQFVRRGFTMRPAIPMAGIIQIAFDAVKISVHPGAIAAVLVHDDLMRSVPVVVGRPPQRAQRG